MKMLYYTINQVIIILLPSINHLMKKLRFTFLILLGLISCLTMPKYIKNRFSNCYNGEYTRIDSLINIEGIYSMASVNSYFIYNKQSKRVLRIDTNYVYFIFWPDGMFLFNLLNSNLTENQNNLQDINRINGFLYRNFYWGSYKIQNDTIIAQYFNNPYPYIGKKHYAYEIQFKVVDRNTLSRIIARPLFRTDNEAYYEAQKNKIYMDAKFYHLHQLPYSDGWIKKRRWFWCDKLEWKAYKDSINSIK